MVYGVTLKLREVAPPTYVFVHTAGTYTTFDYHARLGTPRPLHTYRGARRSGKLRKKRYAILYQGQGT